MSDGSDSPGDDTYPYPRDEFDVDNWEGPRGAHRAARKGWFIALPWLAGGAAALTVVVIAVSFLGGSGAEEDPAVAAVTQTASATQPSPTQASQTPSTTASASPTGTPTPTASPAATVDKTLRTQILNSTRTQGLAARLGQKLTSDGWTMVSTETYRKSKPPTTVYYRDATDKATAEALAKAIGGVPINQTQSWQAPITVMLGADFQE